jgi:hypothetical protein
MSQTIKLKEVLIPKRKDYVRGVVDKKNLADLLIIAKDAKHTGWPFHDAIVLRKLTKPTKDGKLYGVLDGVHRCTVYKMLHRPSVEADIKTLTDKEAAILQFTSNLSHGIRLNRKARNSWVKHMRFDLGMKLAEIAKEVGMTETSVSRMARDKQTKAGPRKKSAPRVPGSAGGAKAPAVAPKPPKPADWSINDFLQRVKEAGSYVAEHPETIKVYARQHSREIVKMLEPLMEVQNAALAIEATGSGKTS